MLIHSAFGGLGIASIQLCQYLGAEIFATVSNDEKRTFLIENFGIPSSNIFNSRSTAFASELMQVTNGSGVNVILNSLTGDLLDASWRCIAPGGTMVELGKKDMLDRNTLAMEPFGRNASYRCFDMSHEQVTDTVIGRLMTQMFDLLQKRHIKPIYPIKTFTFDDITSAFRYMRSANHIGKIVISNGNDSDIEVPVSLLSTDYITKIELKYLDSSCTTDTKSEERQVHSCHWWAQGVVWKSNHLSCPTWY